MSVLIITSDKEPDGWKENSKLENSFPTAMAAGIAVGLILLLAVGTIIILLIRKKVKSNRRSKDFGF